MDSAGISRLLSPEVQITVYRSVTQAAIGITFLSLNKKVTKEVSIGEALTAKSIGTSSINRLFYPDFEPPSPMYLSRPLSKDFL